MDSEQEPLFYGPLREQLSQGDIVTGIPAVVLEHPLEICRKTGRPNEAKVQPLASAEPPAFHKLDVEILHARGRKPGFGMVIWDDCQIDDKLNQGRKDPSRWFVSVAPIFPITIFPENKRAAVIDGRRYPFFHLPQHPGRDLPESYVDLRMMWPIKQAALTGRLTSLSDGAREALHMHLFRFLTGRSFVVEPKCGTCGAMVDPQVMFEKTEEEEL